MIAGGHIVVAAVGNDGPAAPPLYPAAYPDVVGVTGVDAHQRVLVEAERGNQVEFAAPGADMVAATSPEGYSVVRGTSFAAPLVAGLLAPHLMAPDPRVLAWRSHPWRRRRSTWGPVDAIRPTGWGWWRRGCA